MQSFKFASEFGYTHDDIVSIREEIDRLQSSIGTVLDKQASLVALFNEGAESSAEAAVLLVYCLFRSLGVWRALASRSVPRLFTAAQGLPTSASGSTLWKPRSPRALKPS